MDIPLADLGKLAAVARSVDIAAAILPDGRLIWMRPRRSEPEAFLRAPFTKFRLAFDGAAIAVASDDAGPVGVSPESKALMVAGDDIAKLPPLKELTEIHLSAATDDNVPSIATRTKLIDVHLSLSKLSDEGLAPLKNMKSLEELNIHSNERVTGSGLVQKAMGKVPVGVRK